jgi:DNA-binding NarL/FixJ family response regulator
MMASRVIFVVEDNWRTRNFICTVLKYSDDARVIESSNAHDALVMARELACGIDLLISNIDLADARTGMDLAREIVANNPSTRVLLLSLKELPPSDFPLTWKFL